MLQNLISILTLFILAISIAGGIIIISSLLSKGKKTDEKLLPYECGLDSISSPRTKFSIKFYVIAILFIIFDVEIAFLYPWAIVFQDFCIQGEKFFAFASVLIFVFILLIGFIYAWAKGALSWEE